MKNMAATAEAAKTSEVAEMVEATKAAERAVIVEAKAVKIAAGAVVRKNKVASIPTPAIRPLARLLLMSRTPQSLGMLKPLRPCNGAGHFQLPTRQIFG